MFDNLTLFDLYSLHSQLCAQYTGLWEQIMAGDPSDSRGAHAIVDPLSEQWQQVSAQLNDIDQTAAAVYAEIGRREQELAASA
jgi:hypothetical protein